MALALLVCASGPAHAAPAPPTPPVPAAAAPGASELDLQEQAPPAHSRRVDLFAAPEPAPCPFASSTFTFALSALDVTGSTRLTKGDLAAATRGLVGPRVPVAAICKIRDRLGRALFRRGVLARVEAPPQTVSNGRLKLIVIEARIVAVHVHGEIGPAQAKAEAMLDRLRGLTPFDLDMAQRYLLLVNDIPGIRATALLRPSLAADRADAGAVDLEVQLERAPIDEVVAVQNTGSKALGRSSVLGRVDLDSFTALGEQTSLIVSSTFDPHLQKIIEGIEQVRLGDGGVYGQASLVYGDSHPGSSLAQLDLTGTSLVASVEIDEPIIRLERRTVTLAEGFDVIDQTTLFPGGATVTRDHLRIAWARASASMVQRLGPGVVLQTDLSLSFRVGIGGLGASKAGDSYLSRPEGRPDGWTGRLESNQHLLLANLIDLGLHVQAQYAPMAVLAYEQLALGNLTIGRGYDPDSVTGDYGIAGEFTAGLVPVKLGRWATVAPYGFFDAGTVNSRSIDSQWTTVRSYGGGLRMRLPYGVIADLYYAAPMDKPFPAALSKPSQRLMFQVAIAR